jgi:hypothetical protein
MQSNNPRMTNAPGAWTAKAEGFESGTEDIGNVPMNQSEYVSLQGAGPDQFAHGAQQPQGPGESEPDTQSVGRRLDDPVFGGECLGAAQNDAVDHDQGDEHAQVEKEGVGIGLHHLLDDDDESGDDDNETGDAHLGGMTLRSSETRMLEHSSTKVVASPMPMPFSRMW